MEVVVFQLFGICPESTDLNVTFVDVRNQIFATREAVF